jgi:hypothetical protein
MTHVDTDESIPIRELVWPDEIAAERATFYGIRTASLLANEPRWTHRRVERLDIIDERRLARHVSVDFTLPDLPNAPWDPDGRSWLVPVALLQKRLLRALNVRDEAGAALPVLTREQNAVIACALLRFFAVATLEDVIGVEEKLADQIAEELSDIAGGRRGADDFPSEAERADRTSRAVQTFRRAGIRAARSQKPLADPVENQRQILWRDETMRGFMTILAERFLLLVAITGHAGDRRIVKIGYEQNFDAQQLLTLDPWKAGIRALARRAWSRRFVLLYRAKVSLGLAPYGVRVGTRAGSGPESYHVEIAAPEELVIERARLDRLNTITDLATGRFRYESERIAEDRCTERAHLYDTRYMKIASPATPPRANEEAMAGSTITAELFIRPSFVRPALAIGWVTTGMLLAGLILTASRVHRNGDVTALIVVLPALFAAYLIPGEHRLVRLMFRWLRGLVFLLAVISFGAAASLTLGFDRAAMVVIWLVLFGVAAAATTVITIAFMTSNLKMRESR